MPSSSTMRARDSSIPLNVQNFVFDTCTPDKPSTPPRPDLTPIFAPSQYLPHWTGSLDATIVCGSQGQSSPRSGSIGDWPARLRLTLVLALTYLLSALALLLDSLLNDLLLTLVGSFDAQYLVEDQNGARNSAARAFRC